MVSGVLQALGETPRPQPQFLWVLHPGVLPEPSPKLGAHPLAPWQGACPGCAPLSRANSPGELSTAANWT